MSFKFKRPIPKSDPLIICRW